MNNAQRFFSAIVAALLGAAAAASSAEPQSATVPIALDHNRMTVAAEFLRADGSLRQARAWVDCGGTGVIMAEPLARDLGVDLTAMPAGDDSFQTKSPVPAIRLGRILLDTEGMNVSVHPSRFSRPGVQAECTLPARCLRQLHAVFDYPARLLTVAPPGRLKPRGMPLAIRVNPDTGLFMVETAIEGEKVSLGVDNGSAGTWVSNNLTAAWLARNPGWPSAVGAAGSTNFFGFAFETQGMLLRLPVINIGSIPVREVSVLGLDQGFFDWYSKKSATPVAGFLGADVIARFRLEVDFPGQMSWWQPGPPRATHDLDIVGLSLRPEGGGSFTVAGVVSRAGQPVVPGVRPGDQLMRAGALDATNAPMGAVIDALRGNPGDIRKLLFERAGKRFTVQAIVTRLP